MRCIMVFLLNLQGDFLWDFLETLFLEDFLETLLLGDFLETLFLETLLLGDFLETLLLGDFLAFLASPPQQRPPRDLVGYMSIYLRHNLFDFFFRASI